MDAAALSTKNIGHITVQKHVNDVSNFLIKIFEMVD
jgi:hypothetical protein